MTYRPAPIETKMINKEGMTSEVWSWWFEALEGGKRTNLGTGQLDALAALDNLDNIIGYGTLILEPTVGLAFYAFKGFVDGQRILVHNNGNVTATINNVTSTIDSNKGLTIQWDKTLNKWLEG